MITARSAHKAYMAIILLVAALVFPTNTWAASGNGPVCQPNTSCTIGEFLYDDSYVPITTASCTVTSRNPDGTLFLNNVSATAASDGWYSYAFSSPSTTGVYRSQLCCTVTGTLMCLDKSFEVKSQSSLSQGEIASAVWNANKSSYKGSGSFGEVLQNVVPTANDIAQATWGYSTRTVTSFGTLVTDIWNSASQTEMKSQLTSIKNTGEQSRTMLEQVVKKPVIQNSLEEDKIPDLQSKLDETKTHIDQLSANTQYVRSKTGVIQAKWKSLKEEEITSRLDQLSHLIGQEDSSKNSMFSQIKWLTEAWDWQEAQAVYTQTKEVQAKLLLVKKAYSTSTSVQEDISSLISNIDKLALLEASLQKKTKQVRELAYALDAKSSDIDRILTSWDSRKDVSQKVNELSKEVGRLNKITKATHLFASVDQTSSQKNIKNKVLDLRGIVEANKKLLAKKAGMAFSSTWLGEGSIIFKSLITNPSLQLTQTVPVKIYLPIEVKKENIINLDDGLSVSYDAEKNQYYYHGEITLSPGETKTLQVRVDDSIFTISEDEIKSMRKQAEDLSKPLNNTPYFAQGVSLKSDIDVALDKVVQLQKTGITPDAKIRAYREAQIELQAARTTMGKMKELASTAGSAGTILGFVGGTQTLAVWGLIIIMAAGFVFLALYMRELRRSEIVARTSPVSDSPKANADVKSPTHAMSKHHGKLKPMFKFAVFLLVFGIFGAFICGLVVGAKMGALNKVSKGSKDSQKIVAGKDVEVSKKEASEVDKHAKVLGSQSSSQKPMNVDKKFKLFVPPGGFVGMHKNPSLDSPLVDRFKISQDVAKLEEHDQWVKIAVEGEKTDKPAQGWVDKDFVEESLTDTAPISSRKVTIDETLLGFVWVREKPGGEQIAKVSAGDELTLVKDGDEWLKVGLQDGTSGWIAKKYTSLKQLADRVD